MSSGHSISSEAVSCRVSDDRPFLIETVQEYISGLPTTFDDILASGDEGYLSCVDEELSRLSYTELKRLALDAAFHREQLLHELLDQEVKLGKTVDELLAAKEMLEEREEDVEELRTQLQRADDSKEMLLREKASALRRLMETKNELASVSAAKMSLQRMLELKSEEQVEKPCAPRAPSAATAPSVDVAAEDDRNARRVPSAVKLEDHHGRGFVRAISYAPAMSSFSMNACSLGFPRSTGGGDQSTFDGGLSSEKLWPGMGATTNQRSKSPGDSEWRRLFFEVRRQNELLQSEIEKLRADHPLAEGQATGNEAPQTVVAAIPPPQLSSCRAEIERLREELNRERERNRTRNRLGAQLLRDVAFLAKKVRMYEQAESASLVRRYKDLSLTKEQLLKELGDSRKSIAVLTVKLKESTEIGKRGDGAPGDEVSQQAVIEGLANALEEALRDNEVLREERGSLLSERRFREESYEAELKVRVGEMEKLTAVLDELRGQMAQLRTSRRCSKVGGSTVPAPKFLTPSRNLQRGIASVGTHLTVEDRAHKTVDGNSCSPCTSCSITQNSNTTPVSDCDDAKSKPKLSAIRGAREALSEG